MPTDIATTLTSDRPIRWRRIVVAVLFLALAAAPGQLGELTRRLMTDAFTQVSVFVAATLMIFYGAEKLFRFDIGDLLRTSRGWQVPIASLLGATPGCGGAVVVVAAYSSGNVGFGAVVATLTATMGDAAFLLIATRPEVAAVVLPMSFAVGILSGWIVDRFNTFEYRPDTSAACELAPLIGRTRAQDIGYLLIGLPGLAVGIAGLAQIKLTEIVGIPVEWVGVAGVTLGLYIWASSSVHAMTNPKDSPVTRTAEETSFISVWVIGAYLAYDYIVTFTGVDLASMFHSIAPLLPLIAIGIGLIPGCGPQVLVTTLFINGLIPFSALIGNAISNDGDALFPAIALNPQAAIMATLYSTIPALIVAYGFYFLAPGFMN